MIGWCTMKVIYIKKSFCFYYYTMFSECVCTLYVNAHILYCFNFIIVALYCLGICQYILLLFGVNVFDWFLGFLLSPSFFLFHLTKRRAIIIPWNAISLKRRRSYLQSSCISSLSSTWRILSALQIVTRLLDISTSSFLNGCKALEKCWMRSCCIDFESSYFCILHFIYISWPPMKTLNAGISVYVLRTSDCSNIQLFYTWIHSEFFVESNAWKQIHCKSFSWGGEMNQSPSLKRFAVHEPQ